MRGGGSVGRPRAADGTPPRTRPCRGPVPRPATPPAPRSAGAVAPLSHLPTTARNLRVENGSRPCACCLRGARPRVRARRDVLRGRPAACSRRADDHGDRLGRRPFRAARDPRAAAGAAADPGRARIRRGGRRPRGRPLHDPPHGGRRGGPAAPRGRRETAPGPRRDRPAPDRDRHLRHLPAFRARGQQAGPVARLPRCDARPVRRLPQPGAGGRPHPRLPEQLCARPVADRGLCPCPAPRHPPGRVRGGHRTPARPADAAAAAPGRGPTPAGVGGVGRDRPPRQARARRVAGRGGRRTAVGDRCAPDRRLERTARVDLSARRTGRGGSGPGSRASTGTGRPKSEGCEAT